jgi:hypothetical protein
MKLTKQGIKNLLESEIDVTLWNGCFNVSKAKAKFSKYSLELRVEVTHPFLQWQCGDNNDVRLIYWKGCNGYPLEIPDELQGLVEKMKVYATMSDEEAFSKNQQTKKAFVDAMKELGIN